MKKVISMLLAAALCIGCLAACGGKTVQGPEGALSEIIDKIYAEKDPGLAVGTMEVDLADPDMVKMMTGLDDASKVSEAAVSEAMISAQAYSMVLVRVKDAGDTEAVAKAMHEGINTSKWICVTADDMQVAACGDVILLVMVASNLSESVTAQEIVDAFAAVCGGELTLNLK